MNIAVLTIVLALLWGAATGSFSLLNLLFGAAVGGIGLFLVRDRLAGTKTLRTARRIVSLVLLTIRELFVSAFRVAVTVARPDMRAHVRPAFVAFPLTVTSDAEITLLANLITLTPGTLSVDVSEDRRLLYIHVLDSTDREAVIRDIAEGFEAKVAEVFR